MNEGRLCGTRYISLTIAGEYPTYKKLKNNFERKIDFTEDVTLHGTFCLNNIEFRFKTYDSDNQFLLLESE